MRSAGGAGGARPGPAGSTEMGTAPTRACKAHRGAVVLRTAWGADSSLALQERRRPGLLHIPCCTSPMEMGRGRSLTFIFLRTLLKVGDEHSDWGAEVNARVLTCAVPCSLPSLCLHPWWILAVLEVRQTSDMGSLEKGAPGPPLHLPSPENNTKPRLGCPGPNGHPQPAP